MQGHGPDSSIILAPPEGLAAAESGVYAEFAEADGQLLPFGQVEGAHISVVEERTSLYVL